MAAMDDDKIGQLFRAQRANRQAIRRTTAEQRIAKLDKLRAAIVAREQQIRDALFADFRKSPTEVDMTEIFASLVEIKDAMRYLPEWMAPRRVPTPASLMGTRSEIQYEPRGVVLIIGPWNYPFQLCIAPLVAAIAAGNCAMIKPSELTGKTSTLVAELIAAVFPPEEITVVEGDAKTSTALLALPFDHIFFTGSTRVGRIVAEAAAKHLASTTLELGGKSPCIVDETADLTSAAKRIVWGKYVNAGQTCIAPDYILVPKAREAALVEALGGAIKDAYGATPEARKASTDLCRIIDDRNFTRLTKLLDETVTAGAKIAVGGERDAGERYIAPTVVTGVTGESALMSEEIFGPILPILTYDKFDEVAPRITAGDKPLALYMFGSNRARNEQLLAETTAGGTCVNTTILHFANPHLPFGGVGASGLGSYHGEFGFRAFSHERAVLRQGMIDMTKGVYPPYTPGVKKLIRWMFRLFT